MARFYGEIKGKAASKATREGDERSGMDAHIRGWNAGIKIECGVDRKTGEDVCRAFATGGSRVPTVGRLLGTVRAGSPTVSSRR